MKGIHFRFRSGPGAAFAAAFASIQLAAALSAYDYQYDAGTIEGTLTSSSISYTLSVDKAKLGTTLDFDTTPGVTTGMPAGISIQVTSGGATGVKTFPAASPPAANFTISMNGKLIPVQGGQGGGGVSEQPTWSAYGTATVPYHIRSDQDGGAKEISVPAGTSVTYTAFDGSGRKSSNWNVNGQTKNNESSIIFSRSWWDVPGWFSASMGTPDPGVYNITARPADNPAKSDSGKMTVVGIDRITPNADSNTSFWQELANAGTDYSLCIETNESLTLKAYPSGSASWPVRQPQWSSSGSWLFSNHIIGNASGTDTVAIDTSQDNDNFVITASCGVSEKKVSVRTFQYKFNLYVEAPTNTGEPFTVSLVGSIDVGHTWWKFEISNGSIAPDDINITANAKYINNPVGYYPSSAVTPSTNFSAPGEIYENDTAHSPTKTKTETITRNNFISGLAYTGGVAVSPGTYAIAEQIIVIETPDPGYLPIGTYTPPSPEKNCTTVALGAANAAGVSTPDAYQDYTGSWFT